MKQNLTTTTPLPRFRASVNRCPARAGFFSIALLAGLILALSVGTAPAQDNRAPEVPAALAVPDGNKVLFHAYAVGVQIYVSTPSPANPSVLVWTFKAPEAVLFDNDGNFVGTHYAGPTWESNSGSKILGARVAGATVDPTAIPWLLLAATATEGPGIFERTTYVQRVNTVGGLAPSVAPTQAGLEVRVPYTADYYFFRESQH